MNTGAIIWASLMLTPLQACRSRDQRMAKLTDNLNAAVVSPRNLGGAMVIGDTDLTGNRNVAGGMPEVGGSHPVAANDVILSRSQFVVAFDAKAKIPTWTSWQIVAEDVGETERSNDFKSDEILDAYLKVKERDLGLSPKDYTNTCFDKGHQSPSADRSRNTRDNNATFYMSNMAPQTAFLNRRIWKDLEQHSRELVKTNGYKLQVFAGAILRDGREGIGPNKDIQVPEAFYKVIALYDNTSATSPKKYIAVVMPNVTADGLDPLAERETNCAEQKKGGKGKLPTHWEDYKVSLSDIETKAGVKFPQLAMAASL